MSHNKGFTLIELMVTIAIFAVLAGLITPSFLQWIDRTKVKGDATNLRAAFESAKLRAIKHNTNVIFTFPNATSYRAYIDANKNNVRDTDETIIFDKTLSAGDRISENTFSGNTLIFDSRGMADVYPGTIGSKVTLISPRGKSYEVQVLSFGNIKLTRK